MDERGAGWKLAGTALFVWPLVWFFTASCCCSAPLAPLAQPGGDLAQILRVFAAPLSAAAGVAVGESLLIVLQFWDRWAPPERRIGATRRLLASLAVGLVPYFLVFGAAGLLTGVATGRPLGSLAAYLVVATIDVLALLLPFALYAAARSLRSEPG